MLVTDAAGTAARTTAYRPYGAIAGETLLNAAVASETKGFIGERHDEAAALQYLNARYYDPKLALFIQPDWFEVTEQGAGTNRYMYAGGDPVNAMDPGGNGFWSDLGGAISSVGRAIGDALSAAGRALDNFFGGNNRRMDSNGDGRSDWAEYQAAAYENGGTLSFDAFAAPTGINLRDGFASPFSGFVFPHENEVTSQRFNFPTAGALLRPPSAPVGIGRSGGLTVGMN